MTFKTLGWTAAGIMATLSAASTSMAQSADALIDKLVQKGILTTKEANELREETDKNFTTAYQVKSGMPDWVTSIRLGGDFRVRAEDFDSDNPSANDRWRFRYRLRFGPTITLWDNFEIGIRLASGDPVGPNGSQGGNPLSANTTFQWDGSRKFIYVDTAYAKWTPIHSGEWTVSGTVGKMDNPFQISNMVFDYDYQPEGAALQMAYSPTAKHTFKANGAIFVLGEINQSPSGVQGAGASQDPYLFGGQLLWEAKWTSKIETMLGVSAFDITNPQVLDNAFVPNVNDGNTRNVLGSLVYNYLPIIGGGSATYKLASFPFYEGEFPLKAGGEYMVNTALSSNNTGYRVGFSLGKAGHKGNWDITYRYQRLEANAWYEEVVDDDNVGYYQVAYPGSGFSSATNPLGAGFRGGTNVKGHLVTAVYSFTDFFAFNFTFYLNHLIDPNPPGSPSQSIHMLADLQWKF